MKNIPEKIYLQLGGAKDEPYEDFNSLVGVTWHKENVYFDDIEYVLATFPEGKEVDIEKLREEFFAKTFSHRDAVFDFFKPYLTNGKEKIDWEQLWDDHSEMIDTDIDDLQRFAGTIVITKSEWKKLVASRLSSSLVQGGEKEVTAIENGPSSWLSCSGCKSSFIFVKYKFCPNCGSKINWQVNYEKEGEKK